MLSYAHANTDLSPVPVSPQDPLPVTGNLQVTGAVNATIVQPAVTWGVVGVPFTSADQSVTPADVTDAPTAGQKIVVDELFISSDTALSVTFKEATSGTVVIGPIYLAANSSLHVALKDERKLATADKKLQVQSSIAGNISVLAGYHSEA
jgi:hypothetical protein